MRHFVQSLHWQRLITDHQPLISLLFSASLQHLRWLFFESPRSALLPLGNTLWYCPLHWQTPKRPVRLDEAPKKTHHPTSVEKDAFPPTTYSQHFYPQVFLFLSMHTSKFLFKKRVRDSATAFITQQPEPATPVQHFSLAPCKFAREGDFTGDQFRFHKMERKDHHTLLIQTYIDPLKGG